VVLSHGAVMFLRHVRPLPLLQRRAVAHHATGTCAARRLLLLLLLLLLLVLLLLLLVLLLLRFANEIRREEVVAVHVERGVPPMRRQVAAQSVTKMHCVKGVGRTAHVRAATST
jgi:hypothetical protein